MCVYILPHIYIVHNKNSSTDNLTKSTKLKKDLVATHTISHWAFIIFGILKS